MTNDKPADIDGRRQKFSLWLVITDYSATVLKNAVDFIFVRL